MLQVEKQHNAIYEKLDNGVILITTSYLDRHNDYIQIYCTKDDKKTNYVLTDDSWTLDDLEQAGFSLDSARNQNFLKATLNNFGISRQENALYVKTDETELNIAQENFAKAMFQISNMELWE